MGIVALRNPGITEYWEQVMTTLQFELVSRWKTAEGKAMLCRILEQISIDSSWANCLIGFPFANQVANYSDLRGVDLSGQTIVGGQFGFSSLDYAVFDNALLDGSDFQLSSMRHVSMRCAQLNRCNLVQACAENSVFDYSSICDSYAMNSVFLNTSLAHANMSRTALSWAKFDSCNLKECRFEGADLYGAVFLDSPESSFIPFSTRPNHDTRQ